MIIHSVWEVVQAEAAAVTGKLGVCFTDLKTGERCSLHGDEPFPSASVFKIFVLAELFRQAAAGRFDLDDRYPLREEDKSEGSGVLQLLAAGMEPTLRDYATLMMILSDNTAADFLFRLTGKENIRENVLKPLGLVKTKCDLTCSDLISICYQMQPGQNLHARIGGDSPFLLNTAPYIGALPENDETSPHDVSALLERLYLGKWIDRKADTEMLEIMKRCQTNARIPKYLPKGTAVAHKTGTMDRVANDAGIIYTPEGDYILSMFYNGNMASEQEYLSNDHNFVGDELLARLSQKIYDIYTA
ncbi:MAG: serine hydrolase [Clostridiaceae bacterium]|nr:serine hydrolase [Clostridiaceae bacterium]